MANKKTDPGKPKTPKEMSQASINILRNEPSQIESNQFAQLSKKAKLEAIKTMRLLDDVFMTAAFNNNVPAVQQVLDAILGKNKMIVQDVQIQQTIPNLYGRSARFDVLARDCFGNRCNIEIQRAKDGAGAKRARFNGALIDANLLMPSMETDELPDRIVIFITEKDMWFDGAAIHEFAYLDLKTHEPLNDGSLIIYVNTTYVGTDEIGKLTHDFRVCNAEEMQLSELRRSVKQLKNTPEGREKMCQIMENFYSEGHAEGVEEGIEIGKAQCREMNSKLTRHVMQALHANLSYEDSLQKALASFSEYPKEEVEAMYKQIWEDHTPMSRS